MTINYTYLASSGIASFLCTIRDVIRSIACAALQTKPPATSRVLGIIDSISCATPLATSKLPNAHVVLIAARVAYCSGAGEQENGTAGRPRKQCLTEALPFFGVLRTAYCTKKNESTIRLVWGLGCLLFQRVRKRVVQLRWCECKTITYIFLRQPRRFGPALTVNSSRLVTLISV
jgi:hypothetical protein